MQQTGQPGLDACIHSLRHKIQAERFIHYCRHFGYSGAPISVPLPPFLYHGSQSLTNQFVPNRSIGKDGKKEQKALVYATSDINYAIFLAILRLKNARASVIPKSNQLRLSVDLSFVNGPSSLTSGYLHLLPKRKFRHTHGSVYVTGTPITVLLSIPVTPTDLTVPIYIDTH